MKKSGAGSQRVNQFRHKLKAVALHGQLRHVKTACDRRLPNFCGELDDGADGHPNIEPAIHGESARHSGCCERPGLACAEDTTFYPR
jgi:hypothetical protein